MEIIDNKYVKLLMCGIEENMADISGSNII